MPFILALYYDAIWKIFGLYIKISRILGNDYSFQVNIPSVSMLYIGIIIYTILESAWCRNVII